MLLLAGCGGGGSKAGSAVTTSSSAKSQTSAWSAEAKASARQLLAYTAQGPELDCAVEVLTSVYSPEDWSYAVAHPIVNDQVPAGFPARMTALDDQSRKLMESRCGIKDTRSADAAKAAAMKAYNDAVGEWNTLTEKRDAAGAKTVVVNGRSFEDFKAWATANGKPTAPPG
ncbi:MAG TPA: hypothetical protein VGP90_03770 [Acidimicrobiia bacterium]|nr:hypothetical protein [Acidimicrobiia bacterium]